MMIRPKIQSLIERAKARGVNPKTLLVIEDFEAAVARNPKDASAYSRMGRRWHLDKRYADALEHLNISIELDAKDCWTLCYRADLCATCPEEEIRNG